MRLHSLLPLRGLSGLAARAPGSGRPRSARPSLGALASALVFALIVGTPAGLAAAVRIGTVRDGVSERAYEWLAASRAEVRALLDGEIETTFDPSLQLTADWTHAGAERALETLLADPTVDVVIALGPVASQALVGMGPLPKPALASAVLAPALAGLPAPAPGSGVRNLAYLTVRRPLEDELALVAAVVPGARLAILANDPFWRRLPEVAAAVERMATGAGVASVEWRSVTEGAAAALASLPEAIDAVYLLPLPQLTDAERRRLLAELRRRGIASFAWEGREQVAAGALAGYDDGDDRAVRARRIALDLQRILLGEAADALPVELPYRGELVVGLDTAAAIGRMPPWDLLIEADLVAATAPDESPLTVEDAVARAVGANLDLMARRAGVDAGAQAARAARAHLLPDASLAVGGSWIDPDRAASPLAPAERTWSASLGASWAPLVEPLWADLAIQRELQRAREADLEQLRLDIAQGAATAFFEVLRARALERIRRDDLRLTRSHLGLARTRVELGVSSEAEVARWESELATARRSALDAWARRSRVEIELLRLLHRPLGAARALEPIALAEPTSLVPDERFLRIHRDPLRTRRFEDFLVAEGVARAPEIVRLDDLVRAKQRELLSARRSFWLPRVALDAGVRELLGEAGEGADAPSIALPGGTVDLATPERSWSIGLTASLRLDTGGELAAARARAQHELDQLRATRSALAERVESRIRAATRAAVASFLGIRFSRDGAVAAARNLEIVTDAYARGVVSVLDLLDAQGAARAADEAAANATYEFLVDLVETQRAANRLDFFSSAEERSSWLAAAAQFVETSR